MSATTNDRDWPALAKAVRERRLELGIPSQRVAAEQAGIHINTWNAVENGKAVRMDSLMAMAKVLRWPPSYPTAVLRQGEDAPKPAETGSVGHVSQDATARPETVRAHADVPGASPVEGRLQAEFPPITAQAAGMVTYPQVQPISKTMGTVNIPIPVPLDIVPDLDESDLAWLFHWVQGQGTAVLKRIAAVKRAERNQHLQQDDKPDDER